MPSEPKPLELHNVGRTFGPPAAAVTAVRDLSLEINAGEVVGVLGPNGAGKTTTVKMAATLLEPTTGSVLISGVDAIRRPRVARQNIGLVLGGDRGFYLRASARENLDFFAELQGVKGRKGGRVDAVLDVVGLRDRASERVETYSRGMRQRLHIARALLAEPRLVLLDEPSIGLDPEGAHDLRAIVRQLREADRGILLTTHYLQEAEALSDRLIVIANGHVVTSGSTADIAREAGVGTVTSMVVHSSDDPRELLRNVPGVADVTTNYQNGIWSADVIWSAGGSAQPELQLALGSRPVLSMLDRVTSLEEAYLAFLHRHRDRPVDGGGSPA